MHIEKLEALGSYSTSFQR